MTQETGLRWLALVALLVCGGRTASKPACQWCSVTSPCVSVAPQPPCKSLVSPECFWGIPIRRLSHLLQHAAGRSLLVQPIHRTPVVSFPRTSIVMDGQEEKCEYHLVDFIFVVFHETMLPFRGQGFNRCRK